MNSGNGLPILLGALALLCAVAGLLLHRIWQRRFLALKQEMERFADDLLQAVELQSELHRRISRGLSEVEGRILEWSAPSSETPPPLERRHQVLTLARKGISADEIARRLNLPKGETDLIMSLRKYMDAKAPEKLPATALAGAHAGGRAR